MDASITRLDRIRAEARQAAAKYSDINDACPYPWGSPAAIEFKREFAIAREALLQTADDSLDEEELPSCTCTDQHTPEELDFNSCDSCGKPINP
jgi:hypothetical protein